MTNTAHTPPAPRPRGWIWPALLSLTATMSLLLGVAAITDVGQPAPEPVPPACLDAIDAAEDGFVATAEAMTALQQAWWAAEQHDNAGIQTAVDDMDQAVAELDALYARWDRARADCRAAAG